MAPLGSRWPTVSGWWLIPSPQKAAKAVNHSTHSEILGWKIVWKKWRKKFVETTNQLYSGPSNPVIENLTTWNAASYKSDMTSVRRRWLPGRTVIHQHLLQSGSPKTSQEMSGILFQKSTRIRWIRCDMMWIRYDVYVCLGWFDPQILVQPRDHQVQDLASLSISTCGVQLCRATCLYSNQDCYGCDDGPIKSLRHIHWQSCASKLARIGYRPFSQKHEPNWPVRSIPCFSVCGPAFKWFLLIHVHHHSRREPSSPQKETMYIVYAYI